MTHKLHRLLDSVYNTPHLITTQALQPIIEYLESRTNGVIPAFVVSAELPEPEDIVPQSVGGVGEICLDGTLTYKPVYGMCGPVGTSYTGILEQAEELIGSGITTLITMHSSPGGQAAHCFSTVDELRNMCDDAGVEWIAYIDTLSASASLAFSVAADETVIHPSASTGSVGCVVCLLDQSKALDKAGLKPVYIASTPGKTPFEDNGSFRDEFLEEIQEDVTRLGDEFAEHVAKYTGLPIKDILAMDAKVFHAEAALKKGLVTAVMDHKTFAKYMADKQGVKNA